MKFYYYLARPGCVEVRTARETKRPVGVYNGDQAGMDTDGGAWSTVCEDHGSVCSHATLRLARLGAARPTEWCEDCREGDSPSPTG